MPSSTVNICVLTLVLLSFQQICFCRPSRTRRGLINDDFVPDLLALSSDKFERADDGKFYLKKSAHKSDSEVKYTSDENAEERNNLDQGGVKTNDAEIAKSESETIQIERSEPVKGDVGGTPIFEVVSNAPIVEEMKVVKQLSLPKTEAVIEDAGKNIDVTEKAPITSIDSEFTVPPKPDSKDEIPLKKTELPPVDLDEKVEDKVSIGQFPDLYHRLAPVPGNFRIPILIPIRHISYKAVKVMPLPPADVSDRLPLPYEDDIVGEGAHESESEVVSEPIAEEKKDDDHYRDNPLVMGVHFPLLSFRTFLNNLKETDKKDIEKESKVVDVLGKKFLMQSNVMKYPSSDSGQTYLRFLSIKPLEEVKPLEPKGDVAEEALDKIPEVVEMKKEESAEEAIEKKEKDLIESEIKKEKEIEKEAEILKAEETEIKMKVEHDVPKDVILKNMGEPEMKKKTEDDEKEMTSSLGKTETPIAEKKGTENGDEEEMQMKADEKKMATVDALLKTEHSEKDTEIASKKEVFWTEKKKEKSLEKSAEIKPKKSEKKKKKCKCEEKDSDSDDDSDE